MDYESIEAIVSRLCHLLYDAMPGCYDCDRRNLPIGPCGVGLPDLDVVEALGSFLEGRWTRMTSTYGDYRRFEHLIFHMKELAKLLLGGCKLEDKEIWEKILDFGLPVAGEATFISNIKVIDGKVAYQTRGNDIKKIVSTLSRFLREVRDGNYDQIDAENVLIVRFKAIDTIGKLKDALEPGQLEQLQGLMANLGIDDE